MAILSVYRFCQKKIGLNTLKQVNQLTLLTSKNNYKLLRIMTLLLKVVIKVTKQLQKLKNKHINPKLN